MTLAEMKEPVKIGKRKVREWEEEPEVTEWRTRMEEKVENGGTDFGGEGDGGEGGENVNVGGGEITGAVGSAGGQF